MWGPCPEGIDTELECTSIAVPDSYDDPGGSVSIALIRVPAPDPDAPSIFVNPGGPGGSGVAFVADGFRLDPATMAAYHLVGFDPRGVGRSDPLACVYDFASGPLPDRSPDNPDEVAQLDRWAAQLAETCDDADGSGLANLGTLTVTQDLDRMRRAVGDDRLNYYGFSYGTLIGLEYLRLFPSTAGRVVLDGVVDPTTSLDELLIDQATAFETALASMDAACDRDLTCPPDGILATYDRVADRLEADGPVGEVGPTELAVAATFAGYSTRIWPALAEALTQADQGSFDQLDRLNDAYYSAFDQALYTAVECIDSARPIGPEAWDDFVDRAEQAAPRLGPAAANDLRPCAFWPIAPPTEVRPSTQASDAGPILVIGTTGDPATPFKNAEAVATALDSGVLITHQGDGHTAYRASDCVQEVVAQYFGTDDAPKATTC